MDHNLQAMLLFAIPAAFTPGPNNLLIAVSGTNFGYWRSFPHIMGVTLGFPAMLIAMAFGLIQIFETWPILHKILRYAGASYMVYLAYRIATSNSVGKTIIGKARPLSFVEAALFQWINPKAVIYALSALSIFTTPGEHFAEEITRLTIVALGVSFCSISTWCLFGSAIGYGLKSPGALKLFNYIMAIALLASIVLILK